MTFDDGHKCQTRHNLTFMTVIKCHYGTLKYVDMGIKLTIFFSTIQKKELQHNNMYPKNKNYNFIFSVISLCILLSKM